jgi:hypothetical protein
MVSFPTLARDDVDVLLLLRSRPSTSSGADVPKHDRLRDGKDRQ